jgi:hypothetical protein
VQIRPLLGGRLHRSDFDVVLRESISQVQAFSQCFHKPSMARLCSSIDFDDVVLIGQMIRDGAFHGTPMYARTASKH